MTYHVLRCRPCGNLLRKQAKNVLFLGRERKQFYVWSPLVLQVLHAVHTLPPLSSWHWPKVAVHVFMWLVPKSWWLDQMKGCFYLCATCVEKVPLTELVLHGWLEINEWIKEATANTDLWSTNAKPPPPVASCWHWGLGVSRVAFSGQKLCAGLTQNNILEWWIHRHAQKFRI